MSEDAPKSNTAGSDLAAIYFREGIQSMVNSIQGYLTLLTLGLATHIQTTWTIFAFTESQRPSKSFCFCRDESKDHGYIRKSLDEVFLL